MKQGERSTENRQADFHPYYVQGLMDIAVACDRWLEARGLKSYSMKEIMSAQYGARASAKLDRIRKLRIQRKRQEQDED